MIPEVSKVTHNRRDCRGSGKRIDRLDVWTLKGRPYGYCTVCGQIAEVKHEDAGRLILKPHTRPLAKY